MSWFQRPVSAGRRAPAQKQSSAQRLSICKQCPQLSRDGRCTHCGCFMRVKAKKGTATCPEGRWK